MDSWAVDLPEVGAIYPFRGPRVSMVISGVVFWLGWHVIQMQASKPVSRLTPPREFKVETDGKSLDRVLIAH